MSTETKPATEWRRIYSVPAAGYIGLHLDSAVSVFQLKDEQGLLSAINSACRQTGHWCKTETAPRLSSHLLNTNGTREFNTNGHITYRASFSNVSALVKWGSCKRRVEELHQLFPYPQRSLDRSNMTILYPYATTLDIDLFIGTQPNTALPNVKLYPNLAEEIERLVVIRRISDPIIMYYGHYWISVTALIFSPFFETSTLRYIHDRRIRQYNRQHHYLVDLHDFSLKIKQKQNEQPSDPCVNTSS